MSKAARPKQVKDKVTVIGIREIVGDGIGNSDDRPNSNPIKCWEFQLVSVTHNVVQVEVGTEVKGLLTGGSIGVSCQSGVLGFAPADNAQEIIEAYQHNEGKHLKGNVLATNNEKFIIVRICLR